MPDRSASFLYPKERDLLNGEPVKNENQQRYRLQEEVANPEAMGRLLDEFTHDIRVLGLSNEAEELRLFTQGYMPIYGLEDRVRYLKTALDHLLTVIEAGGESPGQFELYKAKAPLREPLEFMGDIDKAGVEQLRESGGHESVEELLIARRAERDVRFNGLKTVIREPGALEILQEVEVNGPGCELPKNRLGDDGEYWSAFATRTLCANGGPSLLKREQEFSRRPTFTLTDHGRAVLKTYQNLKGTDHIKTQRELQPDKPISTILLEELDL